MPCFQCNSQATVAKCVYGHDSCRNHFCEQHGVSCPGCNAPICVSHMGDHLNSSRFCKEKIKMLRQQQHGEEQQERPQKRQKELPREKSLQTGPLTQASSNGTPSPASTSSSLADLATVAGDAMDEDWPRSNPFLEILRTDIMVPSSGNRKRKTMAQNSSPPVKTHTVAREGSRYQKRSSVNTFQPQPMELAVASWNINHFKKAKEKKAVLAFLFRDHPWLDIVVLQEVNQEGRTQLDALLKTWEGQEDWRGDIVCEYGPLMQSLSSIEEPASAASKQQLEEETVDIGDATFACRKVRGLESFKLKAANGQWVWMRPGQQEYYPILYRKSTVRLKSYWATYKGTDRLREQSPLYWAKTGYWLLAGEFDEDLVAMRELLDRQPYERELPKKVRESLGLKPDDAVVFDKISNGGDTFSKGKDPKQTQWAYRRWPFEVNNRKHRVVFSQGKMKIYSLVTVIEPKCRPVIVYKVQMRRGGKPVRIGVVHTTPNGSKMNRGAELRQVNRVFKVMGRSKNLWLAAGDYYLDPETPVEGKRSGLDGRERLFDAVLEDEFLTPVIGWSATNQSHIGNYDPEDPKDQWITSKKQEGKDVEVHFVNKRADFMVCNQHFDTKFGGIFSPAGGVLLVDPRHNALNWWGAVSDHAPVAGILSLGPEKSCKRLTAHGMLHHQPDEKLVEQMKAQVDGIHERGLLLLRELNVRLRLEMRSPDTDSIDLSDFKDDILEGLHSIKSEVVFPMALFTACHPKYLLAALLLLLKQAQDIYDSRTAPRDEEEETALHLLTLHLPEGYLRTWLSFWSDLSASNALTRIRESLPTPVLRLVTDTQVLRRALRMLDLEPEMQALTPEAETYAERNPVRNLKGEEVSWPEGLVPEAETGEKKEERAANTLEDEDTYSDKEDAPDAEATPQQNEVDDEIEEGDG